MTSSIKSSSIRESPSRTSVDNLSVVTNEYAEAAVAKDDEHDPKNNNSQFGKYPPPSYKTKNNIKSVLLLSSKATIIDINAQYCRTRRYDTAGKYRIGPTFITKAKLGYLDEHKPGKLSVLPDENHGKSLEFGLLTYLWTFTDQHDKQEIDLSFLKSLIDSGVNVNSRDEHGQTILHAIVRDWHPDVALFAIRNNANVNAQDHYGRSPLHLAAALNSSEMVRLLLMNGADIHLETTKELQTPIHYAAKNNSLDALKILIKFQGSIIKRDYKGRTVLFVAAEKGSAETAQFLVDIGAPAGVYDDDGNSLLACLLEKIPSVAYRALEQFKTTNVSLKQSYMYLATLQHDTRNSKTDTLAKTPLEIITAYEDLDLIMHPVIQKSIEIKWRLFGKVDTIRKLLITLLYLICWLVLVYTFSDNGEFYYAVESNGKKNWKQHSWKIVFEALIIIFALYFLVKDVQLAKEDMSNHQRWMEWKQHLVRSQYIMCHPAWPGEREALESEAERIRSVPTLTGKQSFWFVYEWINILLLSVIFVTRVLTMVFDDNRRPFLAHKVVFGINMCFSFTRLLKICLRFRFFSVFLKITGLSLAAFVQIGFLYLQFYIPFVAVFWLMYGGDSGAEKIRAANVTIFSNSHPPNNLETIFFNVYEASFGQDSIYKYEKFDYHAAHILIALFHVFATFISFNIFVAFVTSKFTSNYRRCVAEASLLQASIVLHLEKLLSRRERLSLSQYYAKFCNPLVIILKSAADDKRERDVLSKLALAERHITSIENSIRDVEERYHKNDRKSHAAIFESIVGCTSLLESKQDTFCKGMKTELKDISQKQEYMNKYLQKLL